MDRKPIYLEKDDEITSVVDKLKNIDAAYLDIVIPKEAIMLQSVINLKLLKRQAEALGKEITIVTKDKVGAKLAGQIGIPVVSREGEVPKEVVVNEVDEFEQLENSTEAKESKEDTEEDVAELRVDEKDSLLSKKRDSNSSWFKKHRKLVLIGGGVSLLAVFLAAYIYVPLANVNIKLAAEKKDVDISFRASRDVSGVDFERGVIPAREIVEEVEKTESFKATGERDAGERARGTVTIFNEFSTTPQVLNTGDRINAPGGLSFVLVAPATVPGFVNPGTGLVRGYVSGVEVRAVEVGERHNIASGLRLSIPRINNERFYAESTSAFTGGSSRKVSFVTAADIEKAKEATKSAAENDLKRTIERTVSEAMILDGALEVSEVSASSSLAVNAEGTDFNYTIKLKGVALSVIQEDIKSLAENKLKQEIGETKEIVEAGSLISATKVTDFDAEKGELAGDLTGEAYIATRINKDDIRNSINGESGDSAKAYISEIEGVDSVEISFFPRFYNRISRLNNHIYIKIEIVRTDSEQPADENR